MFGWFWAASGLGGCVLAGFNVGMKIVDRGLFTALVLSILLHFAAMVGYCRMFSVYRASYPVAPLAVSLPRATMREGAEFSVPKGGGGKRRTDALPVSNAQQVLHFVSPDALDRSPEVIKDIADDIPILSEYPLGGWAVLLLDVGKEGGVDNVLEVQSDLSPQAFEALRQEFLRVRFRPGTVNGRPVKFSLRIQVGVNPLDRVDLSSVQ